jgi:hypothetical protein
LLELASSWGWWYSLLGGGATLVDGDSTMLWCSWLLGGGGVFLLLSCRGDLRCNLLCNLLRGGPGDVSCHAASHWRYWGDKASGAASNGGKRQLAWFKGWGREQEKSWEISRDKEGACWKRRSAAKRDVRTPDRSKIRVATGRSTEDRAAVDMNPTVRVWVVCEARAGEGHG